MTHDVFISYSSKDKPIADGVCANLESAGIRCWIAPRDITPGEDWPTAITRAISQSRVMVLVFSASSNSSEDVGREIILAANSRLVIIPFKIENVEPEPGKQYYLARTHWLDAINPPTQEQIHALIVCVKKLLPEKQTSPIDGIQSASLSGMEHPSPIHPLGGVKPTPPKKPLLSRYWWIAGAAVMIVCVLVASAILWKQYAPIATQDLNPTTAVVTETMIAPTSVPRSAACAPNCTYKNLTVGFIQTGYKDGWHVANTDSFIDNANQLGIILNTYDADNNIENQRTAFQNFIDKPDINVIVLAALETDGWDTLLQNAQAAGKVVVLEDRLINTADEGLYATYIGFDFVKEGGKAAVAMCKLLEGSVKKNVVELVGSEGHPAAQGRSQGFLEKMTDCGITITQSQTANWNSSDGQIVMAAFLKNSKDIQGVYAQNDDMGFGAIKAIKAAGLRPGKDIKIVSNDATLGAFNAMIAGDLNVTVECNPLLAPQVYEAALKALNGETLPKFIPANESVFYAEDAVSILPTRKY
jgi:ABC-type sugar transport system substrate-binding protein